MCVDFFPGLLSAGAMGLYHGVEHYEKLKINESSDVELFKSSWSKLLTDNFETRYDWSYIVAWVSFFLISMEFDKYFSKRNQYRQISI